MSESDPNLAVTDIDEAYCAACNQSFAIDAQFCPNDGAKLIRLKARPDTMLGRVLEDRFEVRAALGHGGMGTVYRGWQLSVDREVAIKVIHPKLSDDRNIVKRFFREARLASRLSQANIVSVYEFGQTEDGILYLAMELLRGRPLSKDLEAQRPLPMKRIKTIGMQICDALTAAHAQAIVHRDLKPGNIMILDEPPGRDLIKILDFGLAKSLQEDTSLVTRTDAILGTPLYMPPEQILGKPSDLTADLYSLGCILYQLSTGRPPYVGENVNMVLASHVRDPMPKLAASVPLDLREVIERLMQKEPAARYQTAAEVHAAIDALGDDPQGMLTAHAPKAILPPRNQVIESVVAPSAVALAATATPAPLIPSEAFQAPSEPRPTRSRRGLLLGVAVALLGGLALIGWRVTRSHDSPAALPVPGDTQPIIPDVGSAAADAVVELDASPDTREALDVPDAAELPADARRPSRPAKPDAGVPKPARDAAVPPPRSDAAAPPDAATVPRDATEAPKDARPKPTIELFDPDKPKQPS